MELQNTAKVQKPTVCLLLRQQTVTPIIAQTSPLTIELVACRQKKHKLLVILSSKATPAPHFSLFPSLSPCLRLSSCPHGSLSSSLSFSPFSLHPCQSICLPLSPLSSWPFPDTPFSLSFPLTFSSFQTISLSLSLTLTLPPSLTLSFFLSLSLPLPSPSLPLPPSLSVYLSPSFSPIELAIS